MTLSGLFWANIAFGFGLSFVAIFVILSFVKPQHEIFGWFLSVVGFSVSALLLVYGFKEIKNLRKVKSN